MDMALEDDLQSLVEIVASLRLETLESIVISSDDDDKFKTIFGSEDEILTDVSLKREMHIKIVVKPEIKQIVEDKHYLLMQMGQKKAELGNLEKELKRLNAQIEAAREIPPKSSWAQK